MALNFKRISLGERIKIREMLVLKCSYAKIGGALGRHRSSIQREVICWGQQEYDPLKAHQDAGKARQCCKKGRFKLNNERLLYYVKEKLQLRWSPEQISKGIKRAYPDDTSMRISHEAIYLYVYLHSKSTLRKVLISQLRQEKKKRGGKRSSPEKRGKIPGAISIDERPKEVLGRLIPGHWEGDLIIGKNHQSAIGTIVERTTRSIIIVPLVKFDATSVREAFEKEFLSIPEQMKRTLTYDNGKEMMEHTLFTEHTHIAVYFAHPYSPWERPTNENSNGLIRDYYPKGTDFKTIRVEQLKEVQDQLNERPRKVLNWQTPKEVFEEYLIKKIA
jgi:IS30 family transposase